VQAGTLSRRVGCRVMDLCAARARFWRERLEFDLVVNIILQQVAQAVLAHDQLVARDHRRHQRVVQVNFPLLDAHDVVGDVVAVGVGDRQRTLDPGVAENLLRIEQRKVAILEIWLETQVDIGAKVELETDVFRGMRYFMYRRSRPANSRGGFTTNSPASSTVDWKTVTAGTCGCPCRHS